MFEKLGYVCKVGRKNVWNEGKIRKWKREGKEEWKLAIMEKVGK